MKKFYSLFAVAALSVSAYSQVATTVLSEDFASITTGNNTTTGGSSSGWNGNENFPNVVKAYQAGGVVKLGTGSAIGSLTSKELDLSTDANAVKVTFDVKGWTTVEGNIKVTVSGQDSQTVTYSATLADAFETVSLTFGKGLANSTVTIETTAKRAFIDNVKIEVIDNSMAVVDANASKAKLVKNTVVDSNIIFAAKADVKVINANGQVVKTASVNENTTLAVASLAKGMYIVTGTVNGQAVSQKIIKK
ncbi:T9SS type A sorting domain-containing protein [Kaistella sp. BT6-1-3]|uniref:T9SS type A sorting domain-containing protein n=1 Tax=Kaistella yananensis TaxID=2989820 RepID=A0ABT3JKH9_9FLAO|nr:T9SS type A sorting domain-containing protein [Kaistella yananensis]MCW4451254.1 T9SS type A sorting domain-containing protein [Kaistella yananensis]